jgi:hypothetical protein
LEIELIGAWDEPPGAAGTELAASDIPQDVD